MLTARFRGSRSSWMRRDLPWAVVLFLIGAFQVMRGAWVDAAIFAVALALLIAGAGGRWPAVRARIRRPSLMLLASIALAVGVVLVIVPRHGPISGIILGTAGLLALAVAWTSRRRPADAPAVAHRATTAAAIAWSAIIVVAGAWEATAYLSERWGGVPEGGMPAISELLDPLLDLPVGKTVFLLLWLAAGVALLRRGWTRSGGLS